MGFSRQKYWRVISFSRGSSQHRDQTQASRTAGKLFTVWATSGSYLAELGSSTGVTPEQSSQPADPATTLQVSVQLGSSCFPIIGRSSRPMVLKLDHASESPGGPVKTHIAEPHPQSFWFSSSRVGLRICISMEFPGDDADDAGPRTTLWVYRFFFFF